MHFKELPMDLCSYRSAPTIKGKNSSSKAIRLALCWSVAASAAQLACAQSSTPSSSTSSSPFSGPDDPNPYYVGVGEALTHDSNVYRIPGGPSDNYSSTNLRAGFTQPISRQRVFGSASVSYNRYQNESTLNNTSYALSAGANWETAFRLSGDLLASMGRNLSAPTVNAGSLGSVRNVADTRSVDANARWGGASLITLEANAGWSSVDYSGAGNNASNSRQLRAGFGSYYHPGGPLTLGVAGRFNRTESPNASVTSLGLAQADTVDGRNLDFIAAYDVSGFISVNGRLSYTNQTSSTISAQDFSGLTGGLSLNWRPTAKTAFHFDASRDAGSGAGLYGSAPVTLPVSGNNSPSAPTVPAATTPSSIAYENNRITDSLAVGATHATTAKISLNANARYARAHVVTGSALATAGSSTANTADTSKLVSLGATYTITRFWNLGCNLSREWRDVSGGVTFAYGANTATCSTQLTLQ